MMYPIIEIDGNQYYADYNRNVFFSNENTIGYTALSAELVPKRVREKLEKISTEIIEEHFWRGSIAA